MDRDTMVARIQEKLGFRTTLVPNIQGALQDEQDELERGATLPWFLLQEDQVIPLVPTNPPSALPIQLPLPSNFISEADDKDGNLRWVVGTPISPPAAPALGNTIGSCTIGTYYVKITYVGAGGETAPSAEASITLNNSTVRLAMSSPAAVAGATAYNVYASFGTPGAETYQATVNIGSIWNSPGGTNSGLTTTGAPPPVNGTLILRSGNTFSQTFIEKQDYREAEEFFFGVRQVFWDGEATQISDSNTIPTPGAPKLYVLRNNVIRIYPGPDKLYPLLWTYYGHAARLDGANLSNPWTQNIPWLLIGRAGLKMSMSTRDKDAASAFQQILSGSPGFAGAEKIYLAMLYDREVGGRSYHLGGRL